MDDEFFWTVGHQATFHICCNRYVDLQHFALHFIICLGDIG
jgi:hypothetical protein